jgi:branched-chain amino acid transport system ATP-binding protein
MTTALSVTGLGKRFGGFVALRDVSFDVAENSTHAIIGPNGAGKTTLVNTISGLLKPETGSIRLGEHDITKVSAHMVAREGLVRTFQITSLFPDLTVTENLDVALHACRQFRIPRLSSGTVAQTAEQLLDRFGLGRIAKRSVSHLSHGDQRILEVAIALAAEPAIILLDEPTAGMSPDETERFTSLVSDKLKGHHTLVLIEHDMDVVLRTADHITVLRAGMVLASDSPQAIMANPSVQEAYLGRTRH